MAFFVNDPPPTVIYPLSLHDALPISCLKTMRPPGGPAGAASGGERGFRDSGWWPMGGSADSDLDRKSTRLNSSHTVISYAVSCLKKKTADTRPCARCPVAWRALRR